MRTRNRGQKRSIVSSLGLGPKQFKRKHNGSSPKRDICSKYGGKLKAVRKLKVVKTCKSKPWIAESHTNLMSSNIRNPRGRGRGRNSSRGFYTEMIRRSNRHSLSYGIKNASPDIISHKQSRILPESENEDSSTKKTQVCEPSSRISVSSRYEKKVKSEQSVLKGTSATTNVVPRNSARGRPRLYKSIDRISNSRTTIKGNEIKLEDTTNSPSISPEADTKSTHSPEGTIIASEWDQTVSVCSPPNDSLKCDKEESTQAKSVGSVCAKTEMMESASDFKEESLKIINTSDSSSVKRRRGRPPLNSHSISSESDIRSKCLRNQVHDNSSVSISKPSAIRLDSFDQSINGTTNIPLYNQPHLTSSHPMESSASQLIRISATSLPVELQFGATDDVLHEVLSEVNMYGLIKVPIKHVKKGRQKMENNSPKRIDDQQFQMQFDSSPVAMVFHAICKDQLNKELASKDLFLAMNGLLRPGVCEVWRRRRDDRSKQLSRNFMGRLRPNPRPRRYSDMVTPINVLQQPVHTNGFTTIIDSTHPDKIRHSASRSTAVSAARLTAAKKLIRAKSHHAVQTSNQLVSMRSQACLFDEFRGQRAGIHLTSRSCRSAHRSGRTGASMSTRASRHPDVSHHIDWKFCYVTSNKQPNIPSINTGSPRRRRQMGFTSKSRTEEIDKISSSTSHDSSPDESGLEDADNILYDHPNNGEENKEFIQTESEGGKQKCLESVNYVGERTNDRTLNQRSIEERRKKRRRAITFQRKRPNDRFVSVHKEESSWYSEKFTSQQEDDSSISSSTSKSGIVDAYGRSFRQARFYHHRPSKISRIELPSTYRRYYQSDSRHHMHSERSISSHRTRHSQLIPRRPAVSDQGHARHRISRRPDRMCQLTLLDRLVLGLNCSVSQNDDKIHIKQIHAKEFTILTQRMNRTGFTMQSLSLRESANNDAEYNIVLTFSPDNEASGRRDRCSSSRSKLDNHEHEYRFHSAQDRINLKRIKADCRAKRISCSASKRLLSASRISHHTSKSRTSVTTEKSCIVSGYQSDSGLINKHTTTLHREVHSDCEDIYQRPQHFVKLILTRKPKVHFTDVFKTNRSHSVISHDEDSVEKFSRDSMDYGMPSFKSEIHRPRPHSDRHRPVSNTVAHKRPTLPRFPSVKEEDQTRLSGEEESSMHTLTSSNLSTSLYQSLPKRQTNLCVLGSAQGPPFRRHSPRKVIRKVYTGSLTIPKILNRKRPSGAPSSNLGPSSSMSLTVTSSAPGMVTSLASSTVPCITTSTNTICLSTTTAPTVLFHEAQPLPVYSPATQYRRLQAAVTPLSLVQTPISALDQSRVSVAPLSSLSTVSTALSDSRSTGIVRLHNYVAAKSPNRLTTQSNGDISSVSVKPSNVEIDRSNKAVADPVCNTNPEELSGSVASDLENAEIYPTVDTVTSDTQETQVHVASLPVDGKFSQTTTLPSNETDEGKLVTNRLTSLSSTSSNHEDETLLTDSSYTPATSLSASQLLKLKRLHDESGRPIAYHRDSRSPHPPHSSNQVQSPIHSIPNRHHNQGQSIEQEATITQNMQSSQHAQLQQSSQYNPPVLPNNSGAGVDFRPLTTHLNQDYTTNPKLEIDDDDDTEDFELKPVSKLYESNDSSAPSISITNPKTTSSRVLDSSVTGLPTLPVAASVDPHNFSTALTSCTSTSVKSPRLNWSLGRPSGFRLPNYFSSLPSSVRCLTETDNHNAVSGRMIVQNPPTGPKLLGVDGNPVLLSGKPFIPSGSIACSPSVSTVLSMPSGATVMPTINSTSNTLCSGPLKRTVVHKYHSFRKILPKSPDHPALLPSTGGFNITSLCTTPISLTKLPVVGNSNIGLYRSGAVTPNSGIPCEISGDGTYFMDLASSNFAEGATADTIRHTLSSTSIGLSCTNPSVLASNPASQLLKSLLERGDSRESHSSPVSTMITTSSSVTSTNTSSSSGTLSWNQPAHQSRGTWQLGKRAVTSSVHRSPSDSNTPGVSRSVVPSSLNSGSSLTQSSLGSSDHSDSRRSPPIFPPALRLTPGPTSRLQQLQQHYQRQQEAQRRFDRDSPGKLGVADSI